LFFFGFFLKNLAFLANFGFFGLFLITGNFGSKENENSLWNGKDSYEHWMRRAFWREYLRMSIFSR
jgi:hypothetical protein